MTTTDERGNHGHGSGDVSGHEAPDPRSSLPLHPWTALRAATGMLLGADDFEVLMGNPRGKHMLHNTWLHGRGVVWGLGVRRSGEWDLEVSRGLAVDGWGRELRLDAPRCLSSRELLEADHDPTCGTREVELCVVLRFDACLDAEVPALVDPCDVTRESTDYSRVVERARLELVRGRPSSPPPPYHRVRVLLGLDDVGEDDEAGEHASRCRDEVAAAPAARRARELLRHFRCLAALDAADWRPADEDCAPALFPVAEESAGVLLACLRLTVRDESGCPEIVEVRLDDCHRPTVLPTTVVQDLVCALAPGLIGTSEQSTGEGPQVIPPVHWSRDSEGRHVVHLRVTEDLVPGSVRRAVRISSLGESEWVAEDLMGPPRYDPKTRSIVVTMADRPVNPIVRFLVRGTGPTPVYGADPVAPLAGVLGEDPGTGQQGRDAVITERNPLLEGSEAQ
jgi:hypothetical protein